MEKIELIKTTYRLHVDCNEFSPMKSSNCLLRGGKDDYDDNNGISPIMVVGLNEVSDYPEIGGLDFEDAFFLAASPDVYNALIDILNNGLNYATYTQALAAIKSTKLPHHR